MSQLKKSIDQAFLNEDQMLSQIRLKTKQTKPSSYWLLKLVSLSLMVALILVNIPQAQKEVIGIVSRNHKLAYAMISVDVNPSIELYVDESYVVLDYFLVNEDAQKLNGDTWIGQSMDSVLKDLFDQMLSLNLISTLDGVQDYVVISAVSSSDESSVISSIQDSLGLNAKIDRNIQTYVLSASEDDLEAALKAGMSLGLYMINGLVQDGQASMSIQSFASDPNNLEKLEEIAEHQSAEELHDIITALLDLLAKQGVDISSYDQRLHAENEDLEELVEDIKDQFHQDDEDESDDDEENED